MPKKRMLESKGINLHLLNLKRQLSACLAGTVASLFLTSCGVFPSKTLECKAIEPITSKGSTVAFILDGNRIKGLGGSTGGTSDNRQIFIFENALKKDKDWLPFQIKDDKISWKFSKETSYELSAKMARLKVNYAQLGPDPVLEKEVYECKVVPESPEEVVAELQRQHDVLQSEAIARKEAERAREEAERERKADLAKWGPFFADFEVRQQAKKMCNDYSFKMTNQKESWFYDNRTDFETKVIGDKIWIGGPITVKVKDGNVDGSDFRFQKSVDCYWNKSATSLDGGQITVE